MQLNKFNSKFHKIFWMNVQQLENSSFSRLDFSSLRQFLTRSQNYKFLCRYCN